MLYGVVYHDKSSNAVTSCIGYSESLQAMIDIMEAKSRHIISIEELPQNHDHGVRVDTVECGTFREILTDVLGTYLSEELTNDLVNEITDAITETQPARRMAGDPLAFQLSTCSARERRASNGGAV